MLAAAAILAGTLVAGGCGRERPAVIGAVALSVTSPTGDLTVIRSEQVTVSGTVAPASARVRVGGAPATRSGNKFSATVELREGVNVIDVLADGPRRRPAIATVRVRRPVTAVVPELENLELPEARRRLQALGLTAETHRTGGLFDDLLAAPIHVCRSDPEAGTSVEVPGTVALDIARGC